MTGRAMPHHTARFDLRQATPQDIPAVVALDRAVDSAPHWSATVYAAMLSQAEVPVPRCLFVACLSADQSPNGSPLLVGIAVAAVHGSAAQLESVIVTPAARRSGIGRSLSFSAVAWAREAGATKLELEVRAANTPAIALYTQLGFHQIARRTHYYGNPRDDAVLMSLVL